MIIGLIIGVVIGYYFSGGAQTEVVGKKIYNWRGCAENCMRTAFEGDCEGRGDCGVLLDRCVSACRSE